MDKETLSQVAQRIFEEDRVTNDVTSKILARDARVRAGEEVQFDLLAKEAGVFAGQEWIEVVRESLPFSQGNYSAPIKDSQRFEVGTILLSATASGVDLLSVERSFLNMLQHLCGVATKARRFVDVIENTARKDKLKTIPKLLHTRKTLPLLRDLQIEALIAGGAHAHRRDLSSRIMLKDNHQQILRKNSFEVSRWIRETWSMEERLNAIVEVDTEEEALKISEVGVGQLLLDNFSPEQIKKLLPRLPENIKIEVSGGINEANLSEYVIEGVHFISVGALTHSVKSIDISLEVHL